MARRKTYQSVEVGPRDRMSDEDRILWLEEMLWDYADAHHPLIRCRCELCWEFRKYFTDALDHEAPVPGDDQGKPPKSWIPHDFRNFLARVGDKTERFWEGRRPSFMLYDVPRGSDFRRGPFPRKPWPYVRPLTPEEEAEQEREWEEQKKSHAVVRKMRDMMEDAWTEEDKSRRPAIWGDGVLRMTDEPVDEGQKDE